MSIKTGRYGTVKYDAAGGGSPLIDVISINGWKLSLKQDYEDVTCFGDTNKVYVPGMRDVSGTLTGFYNADEHTLIEASSAATPGFLELGTNSNESTETFGGLAYLDLDIDATVKGAPKISSSFRAAGSWDVPAS